MRDSRRWAPVPTRIGSLPTIPSQRCNGFSRARPLAVLRCAVQRRRRIAPTPFVSTRSAARGSRMTRMCAARSKSESMRTSPVLSQDFMTIPIDRIAQTESVLTMLAGRVVYTANRTRAVDACLDGIVTTQCGRPQDLRDLPPAPSPTCLNAMPKAFSDSELSRTSPDCAFCSLTKSVNDRLHQMSSETRTPDGRSAGHALANSKRMLVSV